MDPRFGNLLRRSVEATQSLAERNDPFDDDMNTRLNGTADLDVPIWGVVLLAVTLFTFLISVGVIEYTLRYVVGTLAMVETPAATLTVTSSDDKEALASLETDDGAPRDPEKLDLFKVEAQELTGNSITIVPAKPITGRIKTTIHHITARAGRFARFRGIVAGVVFTFLTSGLTHLASVVLPGAVPLKAGIVSMAVSVVLANFHMLWTHSIISAPANKSSHAARKSWVARLGGSRAFRALLVPTAARAAITYGVCQAIFMFASLTISSFQAIVVDEPDSIPEMLLSPYVLAPIGTLAVTTFSVFLFCALYVPATVAHVRVEASLLPEEYDTIVPVDDRAYGSELVPVFAGGSAAMSFKNAWRSFDGEARRRVLKLFLKIAVVILALVMLMVHVIILEAWLIFGDNLPMVLSRIEVGQPSYTPSAPTLDLDEPMQPAPQFLAPSVPDVASDEPFLY